MKEEELTKRMNCSVSSRGQLIVSARNKLFDNLHLFRSSCSWSVPKKEGVSILGLTLTSLNKQSREVVISLSFLQSL